MDALFELLGKEPHAGVRALLGHFIFVYIHPYMDGNGRIGRFLMNAMFASGGYPWTIIHVANRAKYMAALESASVDGDFLAFTRFVRRSSGGRLLCKLFTINELACYYRFFCFSKIKNWYVAQLDHLHWTLG